MSTTLVREKKVNSLQEKLTELELQIAKGQKAFYQIGSALKIIRDEGLYSSSHSSFGNYCQQVWEMSKRKANYLISAAGVIDNLKNYFGCDENNCSQIPLPANESQVRELAKLSSEEQIKVWEEIIGKVGNGEVVTAKLVKKTISEHYFGSGNDLLFDYSGNEENDLTLDDIGNDILRGEPGCDSICCEQSKTFDEDQNNCSQQDKTLDKNENNFSLRFVVRHFVVRHLILLDSTGAFPSIEKLVEQTISNHLNYYDLPGLGNFKDYFGYRVSDKLSSFSGRAYILARLYRKEDIRGYLNYVGGDDFFQIPLPTNKFKNCKEDNDLEIYFSELELTQHNLFSSWRPTRKQYQILVFPTSCVSPEKCMTIVDKNNARFPCFYFQNAQVKLAIPQSGFTWKNKNKTTSTVEKERSPPGVFIKSYRFTLA